ncbi:hypothetical protein Tco_1106045 [Tanacetum coccineum]
MYIISHMQTCSQKKQCRHCTSIRVATCKMMLPVNFTLLANKNDMVEVLSNPLALSTLQYAMCRLIPQPPLLLISSFSPFILASQSSQVYYASYQSLRRDKVDWWAVSNAKPRSFIDLSCDNMAFQADEVNTHLVDDVDTNDRDDASLGDDTQ